MNTLSLAKSRIETLPLGRAQLVECVSGTLWVTVDAQPEDIVLEAGERFVAPAGERTLVYALSDAQLRVGPLKSAEKSARIMRVIAIVLGVAGIGLAVWGAIRR